MSFFKTLSCFSFIALSFCASAFAASAYPGLMESRQPDGSVVQIRKVGNEHFHYIVSEDSELVARDSLGYWNYADENGKPTGMRFHKRGERGDKERRFNEKHDSKKILEKFLKKKHERKRSLRRSEESREDRPDTTSYTPTSFRAASFRAAAVSPIDSVTKIATRPKFTASMTQGELRGLVILVQFSDVKFKASDPQAQYTRYMNEEGYNENGMRTSVRDYFVSNSMGVFQPYFDVAAPVTLSKTCSYYGSQDYPDEAFVEAIDLIRKRGDVDFSKYDNDGDHYVDFVYMIYAGIGAADTDNQNVIWPQAVTFDPISVGNRYYLYKFACSNEISGNAYMLYGSSTKTLAGIGLFVHEYSHVLGLPDFYDTGNMNNQATPTIWDLMDLGEYNSYADNTYLTGTAPPRLTAYERYSLGWLNPRVLAKENGEITLYGIDKNDAILIPTSDKNEFYMLDFRAKNDEVSPFPSSGMLVWKIIYNSTAWKNNAVNVNGLYRMNLIRADGDYQMDSWSRSVLDDKYLKGDPFPGRKNVVEFGGFVTYAGDSLGLRIYDITETDSTVTFKVKWKGVADVIPSSSSVPASSSSSEVLVESSSSAIPPSSSSVFAVSSSSVQSSSSGFVWPFRSSSSTVALPDVAAIANAGSLHMEAGVVYANVPAPGLKTIRVFDVQGHLLRSEVFTGSSFVMDLNALPHGSYVVRIDAGGGMLKKGVFHF